MATHPIPTLPPDDRPLTADEGWDLIMSLAGSAHDAFAEVGGADAWIRFLREGYGPDESTE